MLLRKSKLFSAIVCMITALSVFSLIFPYNVRAESNDKSITLVCVSGDTVLSGMTWKLYKVGVRTNNGMNFVQTGDFEAIQVNLRRITSERIYEAAQTFEGYAIANGLSPLREGVTNAQGEVEFTGLDSGLYLLSGKLLQVGTNYYVPSATLFEIKEDDSDIRYNAYPKFEYQVGNDTPRRYTAYKKWVGDEEHLDKRPEQVIFEIYKNDEYYDSVVLSAENNWKYSWIDDKGSSSWIVMEKDVPESYSLHIEYDDARYIIYNSYNEENTGTTTTVQSGQNTTTTTTGTSLTGSYETRTRTTTSILTNVSNATVTRTTTVTTVTSQSETETSSTGTDAITSSTETDIITSTTTDTTSTTKKTDSGNSGKGNSSSSGGSSSNKLPQTGQLWWPVVPLSIGGVLLIGAGLVIKARRKED